MLVSAPILVPDFGLQQKWLQYETVLGPEDGEAPKGEAAGPMGSLGANGMKHDDEEKATEGRQFDVSGPGLGDLHTQGPTEAVFDLRPSGPMDDRLDRIESLLASLIASGGADRLSSSTFVDENAHAKNGSHFVENDAANRGLPHRQNTSEYPHHDAGDDAIPHGQVVAVHDDNKPHAPFIPGVAGAAGREHIDVKVPK